MKNLELRPKDKQEVKIDFNGTTFNAIYIERFDVIQINSIGHAELFDQIGYKGSICTNLIF